MILQVLNDLVAAQVQELCSGDKVVSVDVGSAHSAVTVEAQAAVKDAPVVKDEALAGLELEGDFVFLTGENVVPQADGLVELDNVLGILPLVHDGAVAVVPAHLDKLTRHGVVSEDGLGIVGQNADLGLAGAVGGYQDLGEKLVGLRVLLLQNASGLEAVHQHVFAALAVVAKHVEELEARGVAPVGSVCMAGNVEVGVGGVVLGQVRRKVPEAAVVGWLDVGNAFNELFGGLGGDWDVFDKRKAVDVNLSDPLGNAFLGIHDLFEIHLGPVCIDELGIPQLTGKFRGLFLDRHEHGVVGVEGEPFCGVERLMVVRRVPNNSQTIFIDRDRLGLDVEGDFKSVLKTLLGDWVEILFALAGIAKPDIVAREKKKKVSADEHFFFERYGWTY